MKLRIVLTASAVVFVTLTITIKDLQASEPQKGGEWTVVGCDRLGVAVLEDESVLFELKTTFHGWGWKRPRLTKLAEVEDGEIRAFRQNLAFYSDFRDREPLPGTIDLTYELKQTGPNTLLMRFACRPDQPMQFAMPRSVNDRRATVGPFLPPSAYFDGGTCRSGECAPCGHCLPLGKHLSAHWQEDLLGCREGRDRRRPGHRPHAGPPLSQAMGCRATGTGDIVIPPDETLLVP